jgi:acyl dehydratase
VEAGTGAVTLARSPVLDHRGAHPLTALLNYADFPVGRVFELGTVTVNQDEMLEFSGRYDPQRFHLDPEAAKESLLGGLCASGRHTCALWMRMWVDEVVGRTAAEGSPGVPDLRWGAPVFPGDVLIARAEVLTARASKSRPNLGLVAVRGNMHRGEETVMRMDSMVMINAG